MAAQKSLNEDYKSDGKWKEIWRRFKKNKGAVIGLVLLVVLTVILVGAPLFISYDKAITQNMDLMLAKPSVGGLFGNDGYGRDIFARIIYGGRVSIAIAILATISSCLFGSLLGAVAGYFGGKVDSIIMRSLDIFMSVPDILFTMAVTLAYFTNYVRLVRSEVLTLSEQDYVEAAKAGGSSGFRIILSHIIPNAIGVIIVNTTLNIAKIIIYESTLSFLGLGMPAPQPEWGQMLSEAREFMRKAPHLMAFPALSIIVTACSVNLIGDGLRDALDPHLKS